LAAQKTSGVDRTSESLGKVKYTSIKKPDSQTKGHSEEIKQEMIHWGLTSNAFEELTATKKWTACVVGWLVKNEMERISKLPGATPEDIAQAKKVFLPLSGAFFKDLPVKTTKAKAPPPKKRKPLKPLDTNKQKKKPAQCNRS
jgi:hypothetical protein